MKTKPRQPGRLHPARGKPGGPMPSKKDYQRKSKHCDEIDSIETEQEDLDFLDSLEDSMEDY